jgi:hypothetical protein
LEYVFRPMRLRPMWPMYGTYIATLLGLALRNETLTLAQGMQLVSVADLARESSLGKIIGCR